PALYARQRDPDPAHLRPLGRILASLDATVPHKSGALPRGKAVVEPGGPGARVLKPLIGITPNIRATGTFRGNEHVVLSAYVTMIAEAGALPMIVPAVATVEEARAVLRRLDGLLLTGGKDLDPEAYGQTVRHPDRLATPERIASDLAYARATVESE